MTAQLSMWGYPIPLDAPAVSGVRRTDPSGSHAAATDRALRIKRGSLRSKLLKAYADNGMLSDTEAGHFVGVDHVTATRRISELLRDGCIRDTGSKRRTQAGVPARVCAITVDGIRALRGLKCS